jgi:hypothetical protein
VGTLAYLVAIAVVYVILSDGMERAVQRAFRTRRAGVPLHLVEDFEVRPSHGVHAPHVRRPDVRGHPGKSGDPARGDSAPSAVFLER